MRFELPLRKFRINQDGDSTPYDQRSRVNTSESSIRSHHRPFNFKSPTKKLKLPNNSSLKIVIRKRATSDALEKLLCHQDQQLSAIGEIWRAKFASTPYIPSNPKDNLPITRNRATTDAREWLLAKQPRHISAIEEVLHAKLPASAFKSPSRPGQIMENPSADDEMHEDDTGFEDEETDDEFDMRIFKWLEKLPALFEDMGLPDGGFEDYLEDEDE